MPMFQFFALPDYVFKDLPYEELIRLAETRLAQNRISPCVLLESGVAGSRRPVFRPHAPLRGD